MASKQHIRDTINALCKIIVYNGGTKITPEHFRLAKFNKNEVTGVMWKLLFETIWFLKFNTFKTTKDFDSDHNRDIILWTKDSLLKKGYFIKGFYDLPGDMNFGSREILLAFGWLISKFKLLQVFLDNSHGVFEECLPINWESLIRPSPLNKRKTGIDSLLHENDISIDQLSWMVGNLMFRIKGLFTAENELVSLIGKLHVATQGADTPKGHLSALEVFLLKHPKELQKFIEKTRQYNNYLGNILTFAEMQDVFWQWLESVFDAKISESINIDRSSWQRDTPCQTCSHILEERISSISNIQAEIQVVIDKKENWYSSTCSEANCGETQSICQTELQQLNDKTKSWKLSEKTQGRFQTFPELKYGSIVSNDMRQSTKNCAQQEIDVLRVKLSELELGCEKLKSEQFEILNNLVGNLEDSVLIPPIGTSKYTELRNKQYE